MCEKQFNAAKIIFAINGLTSFSLDQELADYS